MTVLTYQVLIALTMPYEMYTSYLATMTQTKWIKTIDLAFAIKEVEDAIRQCNDNLDSVTLQIAGLQQQLKSKPEMKSQIVEQIKDLSSVTKALHSQIAQLVTILESIDWTDHTKDGLKFRLARMAPDANFHGLPETVGFVDYVKDIEITKPKTIQKFKETIKTYPERQYLSSYAIELSM